MFQQPTTSINATTTAMQVCNGSLTHFQYQPPSSFDTFTGVLMILIIIISLAGNILIVYAFLTDPKLRVVNNYFIMNLTLSDILTASLVIPFDADMKLNGLNSWSYGAIMCKVWTTVYTISVPTSILTLCTVSIDRYQAISNPLGYRAGLTLNKTKALCLIGGIWSLSLFMAFLPLMVGSPLNVTLSRDLPPDCPDVYFCYFDMSPSYSAAVTIIAFILPSIAMATLYVRMYIIITYERYICDENRSNVGGNSCEMNTIAKNVGKRNTRVEINTEYAAKNKCNKAEINVTKWNKSENTQNENKKECRFNTRCDLCNTKSQMNIVQNDRAIMKTECDKTTTYKHRCSKAGRNIAEIHENRMKKCTLKMRCNEKQTSQITQGVHNCDKAEQSIPQIDQKGIKKQTLQKQCDENRTSQNIQSAHSSDKTERNIAEIDQKVNESDRTVCAKHEISKNDQDTNNNGNTRMNGDNATVSNRIGMNERETRCNRNSQKNQHSNERNRNPSQPSARNSNTRNSSTSSNHAIYQTKVARHFSAIVLVQLVCWYPYSVVSLVYNLCNSCNHLSSSTQYFLLTIGYLSCAINPYLYAYQQRSFRQVFSRMLGIKR